jgi:small-conductance mechanosensitive channel
MDIPQIITGSTLIMAVIALAVIWFGIKFLTGVLNTLAERFNRRRLLIKRLIPVVKVVGWAVGLYVIIAGIFNPPIETIITVSASIGIAVGFASQDILKNIFGGILIILDKPFQVGDKIAVDSTYGEVLEIGLRSTRVVTDDDSVVSIPNGELMNRAVSNSNSSALDCQVVAELLLPLSIDQDKVIAIGKRAAATSRYVFLKKPIAVHVYSQPVGSQNLLKFRVKAYVLDIRLEAQFRSDMTERVLQELRAQNMISAA